MKPTAPEAQATELRAAAEAGVANLGRVVEKMALPARRSRRPDGDAGCQPLTVGSVLEKQADAELADSADQAVDVPPREHESVFEAGLALILEGLVQRIGAQHDRRGPGAAIPARAGTEVDRPHRLNALTA